MTTTFRAHDGKHYLRLYDPAKPRLDGRHGQVWVNGEQPGPDETWHVEPAGDGTVSLSCHGVFLSGQPDGRLETRTWVRSWERWRLVPVDGGVGVRSEAFGFYLAAEDGGGDMAGARFNYERPLAWETFAMTGQVNVTPTRPIVGRLRLERHAFRDDQGFVNPTYAHAGDLFSVFVRDEARALRELDRVAAAGYHGLRVWITLGCGPRTHDGCGADAYWYGREVGPHVTPDYWSRLRAFRDAVVSRGLRLVGSQGDLTQIQDRRAYAEQLAAVDNERPFLDVIDGGNEMWQNGEPDPRRLAEFVGWYQAAGGRALKTLTDAPLYGPGAPPPPENFNYWSIPPADLIDVHSFRGGHSWDKRRHCWGYTYQGHGAPILRNGINSEPPGNGWRVTATEYKDELDDEALALIALGSILGRLAFVWFSGQGVILEGGLEQEAGFEAVPRAVALLPADVMTFEHHTHSQPTPAGWARVLEGDGDRDLRVDGRIAGDGRFAFTIDGPPGSYALPIRRSFRGVLIHPGTGERSDEFEGRAGDTLAVTFTRGRLFVGRVL